MVNNCVNMRVMLSIDCIFGIGNMKKIDINIHDTLIYSRKRLISINRIHHQ